MVKVMKFVGKCLLGVVKIIGKMLIIFAVMCTADAISQKVKALETEQSSPQ